MSGEEDRPSGTDDKTNLIGQRFAIAAMFTGLLFILALATVVIWAIVVLVNRFNGTC